MNKVTHTHKVKLDDIFKETPGALLKLQSPQPRGDFERTYRGIQFIQSKVIP